MSASMNIQEIQAAIEQALPGVKLKPVRETLRVEHPKQLPAVASFLKNSDTRLDYLSSLTGADYLQYLECVYHLYSMEKKTGPLVLRVRVPRENPVLPSLVPVYRGAEYQEREAYDMFGFIFEGHPDPRRIFMWEGFEGYPMRKDYIPEDADVLEMEDVEWLERHNVTVPNEYKEFAKQLKASGKEARAQRPTEKEPA